ncbi:hypothetical protein B5G20_10030, partial [Collinsella sp. An7]|uniref:hypothetical protein n=1 Tax=Collinsella sp. An7 TaxID=1965651 RepID=UPI000B55377A
FKINKRVITVTDSKSVPYSGSEQALVIGEGDEGQYKVDGDAAKGEKLVVTAKVTGTEVGPYTQVVGTGEDGAVWSIEGGKASNYDVTVSGTLTITKAGATQFQGTVSLDDWTYGEKAATEEASTNGGDYGDPSYTYSSDGGKTWSGDKPSDAGDYMVKATWAATNNCDEIYATDTFKINKRVITVTDSKSVPYSGSEQALVIGEGDEGQYKVDG